MSGTIDLWTAHCISGDSLRNELVVIGDSRSKVSYRSVIEVRTRSRTCSYKVNNSLVLTTFNRIIGDRLNRDGVDWTGSNRTIIQRSEYSVGSRAVVVCPSLDQVAHVEEDTRSNFAEGSSFDVIDIDSNQTFAIPVWYECNSCVATDIEEDIADIRCSLECNRRFARCREGSLTLVTKGSSLFCLLEVE